MTSGDSPSLLAKAVVPEHQRHVARPPSFYLRPAPFGSRLSVSEILQDYHHAFA